jgi:hypothetical protein
VSGAGAEVQGYQCGEGDAGGDDKYGAAEAISGGGP